MDSLLNKIIELEARLSVANPDVLALCEIYPKHCLLPVDEAELQLKGYDLYLPSKSHRGVAIYCKKNLQTRYFAVDGIDFEEHVWCLISDGSEEILVGCIYRSPNSNSDNNHTLLQLLEEIDRLHHNRIVIMGDFNLPHINWNIPSATGPDTCFSYEFVDTLQDVYMSQLVTEPTRMREGQTSNVLDLIITDQEDMIESLVSSSPIGKSDHLVLEFKVLVSNMSCKTTNLEHYAFFNGDFEGMRKFVYENEVFDIHVTHTDDVLNCTCNAIVERINEVTNTFVPKFKSRAKDRPLWMNTAVRKVICDKHKAWNRFQKTRRQQNRDKFKKIRNEVTRIVTDAKKSFEKKLTSDLKTNPKCFWKYVKSKTKTKSSIGSLEKPDGGYALKKLIP